MFCKESIIYRPGWKEHGPCEHDACFRRPGLEELPDKLQAGLQKICNHNGAQPIAKARSTCMRPIAPAPTITVTPPGFSPFKTSRGASGLLSIKCIWCSCAETTQESGSLMAAWAALLILEPATDIRNSEPLPG